MSEIPDVGPIRDDDPVGRILERETRYARAAYDFVRVAVHVTIRRLGEERHLSPEELLQGLREFARVQFGPLTRGVLTDWGVRTTRDIGEIVFRLIEAGVMRKTDDDHLEDFDDVYDFAEAFPGAVGPATIVRDDEDDD